MTLSNAWTFGQTNALGDAQSLFLKVSTGELITAFRRKSVTEDRFRTKTISGGKSGQFKVTSRTQPIGHERGDAIDEDANATSEASPTYGVANDYLDNMKVAEIDVGIDRALTRGFFFDELDEAMDPLNPQLRQEATFSVGEAIARTVDRRRLINLSQGAIASAYNTDMPGGVDITKANIFSVAADTMDALADLAGQFDDNEVPVDGRMLFVRPADKYWMVTNLRDYVINRDYGGAGSVAGGTVAEVMGFEIVSTTNLPYRTNVSAVPEGSSTVHSLNSYTVDNSTVNCIAGHRESLGVLQLTPFTGGPQAMVIEQKRRLGEIIGAKWYGGSKFLRPEACGVIRTA